MKTNHFLLTFLGISLFFACQQVPDGFEAEPPVVEPLVVENPLITKAVFSGYVQKGPFINGSSVMISELDENLNQTGRVYSTRIISNAGAFEQRNIELISPYVELKADGYYFDEVKGKLSPGQITLYALVDVSDINSANVNVLTHLAKPRIEYLAKEAQLPFAEAKAQAEKEILAIFDLEWPETASFESFDLSHDASLIAVASILQGYSQTADVMQLMADITDNIRATGLLSNKNLGSRLASNAKALNLQKVRENLEKKYAELEIETDIPDFEALINNFVTNTPYEIRSLINYPITGVYGVNILADYVEALQVDTEVSIRAEVPEGMSLRIALTEGCWIRYALDGFNWTVFMHEMDFDKSDPYNRMWELELTVSGAPSDAHFYPARGYDSPEEKTDEKGKTYYQGYSFIEYYENGATTPTKVKKIKIEGKSGYLSYPEYEWKP